MTDKLDELCQRFFDTGRETGLIEVQEIIVSQIRVSDDLNELRLLAALSNALSELFKRKRGLP